MKAFGQQQLGTKLNDADCIKEWFTGALSDRLEREAKNEERTAKQFEGCSFMGEWPGSHHLRRACLFREASLVIKRIGL
jgi:hypothetical protein